MTSLRSSESGGPSQALTRGPGERHRDVLHPVDERRLQSLDLAVEVDVRDAVEEVLEHDPDLHPGQVGPEAEVGAAAAEGDVGIGLAGDVEALSGSSKTDSSRLAEMWKKTTFWSASMACPLSSVSVVDWRRKFITGVT
jgi:hypothetical protein